MSSFIKTHYGPKFLKKVKKTDDGCWIWVGTSSFRNTKFTPVRYGNYVTALPKPKKWYSHRFSYFIFKGPLKKGFQIDHLCKNTLCVNPEHLEQVTPRENVLRGDTIPKSHYIKTHCPRGHSYSGHNLITRVHKTGRKFRECRTCKNMLQRKEAKDKRLAK